MAMSVVMDARQLRVVDVGVKELLLDKGLPDYVEFVGFCQDGWDAEVATYLLKKFLTTVLLQIAIVEVAQVEFDVVVDQVVDTESWSRDVEANVHVDVANDDVDGLVTIHLDVVAIRS